MERGLIEEFDDEIRGVLFDVVEDVLKMENFTVCIEPGSKKGNFLFDSFDHRALNTSNLI